MFKSMEIKESFSLDDNIVVFPGECLHLLKTIPDEALQLIVTSPPYNIGKEYENRLKIGDYLEQQSSVIRECIRCLSPRGSICWQVGNYIDKGSIIPLDTALYPVFIEQGLKLRNRIIWHFEHGLHCSRRFSGRYETINWFTKTDNHVFNLDAVSDPTKISWQEIF